MAIGTVTAASLNKNIDGPSLRELYHIIGDQELTRNELFEKLKAKNDSSEDLIKESIDFLILLGLFEEEDGNIKSKSEGEFDKEFLKALSTSDTIFAKIFRTLIESGRYKMRENEFEAFLRGEFSNVFKTSSSTGNKISYWKKTLKGLKFLIEKEDNEICIRYPPELILEILQEDISVDKDLKEVLRSLDKVAPCLTANGEMHKAIQDALVYLDESSNIEMSKVDDLGSGFKITVKPDYGNRNAIVL